MVFKSQIEWLKRQIFGSKSEQLNFAEAPQQLNMAELFNTPIPVAAEAAKEAISTNAQEESDLSFDASVPVEEIQVIPAELQR